MHLDANFSNFRHPVPSYKLQVKTVGRYLHGQFPGTRSVGEVGWVGGRENAKYRSECVGCLVTVKVREVRRRMVKVSWCLSLSCERWALYPRQGQARSGRKGQVSRQQAGQLCLSDNNARHLLHGNSNCHCSNITTSYHLHQTDNTWSSWRRRRRRSRRGRRRRRRRAGPRVGSVGVIFWQRSVLGSPCSSQYSQPQYCSNPAGNSTPS